MAKSSIAAVAGHAAPGFEPVRDAFVENFSQRDELGAACCIYVGGEKVVDLWGGVRDAATGAPWLEDTMVLVFSTSKGLSGLAMALAHSRGLLDYEAAVCRYWPEFAQGGKERVTVRQLLSHQAGLHALDEPVDLNVVADIDTLAGILARQRPAWEPGTRQAYHAITLGFYESELLRRVDPRGRSLGRFFQDEIAGPLGLDFYLRLPDEIPNTRLAPMQMTRPALASLNFASIRVALSLINHRSPLSRALLGGRPGLFLDPERVYVRDVEVPSASGVGTARAIAHAYSVFATGGHELGVRDDTLRALMAPAVPPRRGFRDQCLHWEWELSLGFEKPSRSHPFGHPGAFGTPGWGGSFGFADPEARVGFAYVTNRMGTQDFDVRESALREALHGVIGRPRLAAYRRLS